MVACGRLKLSNIVVIIVLVVLVVIVTLRTSLYQLNTISKQQTIRFEAQPNNTKPDVERRMVSPPVIVSGVPRPVTPQQIYSSLPEGASPPPPTPPPGTVLTNRPSDQKKEDLDSPPLDIVLPSWEAPAKVELAAQTAKQQTIDNYKAYRFQFNNPLCSNQLLECQTIIDAECFHYCENAFFHVIESFLVPSYPLLQRAKQNDSCILYDKGGYLSHGILESLIQVLWSKNVLTIPYNTSDSGVVCRKTSKVVDRSVCFNAKPDADILSSFDHCNGTCTPDNLPNIVRDIQADLSVVLGSFQEQNPHTVLLIERPKQSSLNARYFVNASALETALGQMFDVNVYNGSSPSLSRETALLFGSAKVIVGYHGAGFTNMVYSNNNNHNNSETVAIELFARGCDYEKYFNKRIQNWGFKWVQLVVGDAWANETEPFSCNWINSVSYTDTDIDLILRAVADAFSA
jgi:hypothetical protein